MKNPNDTELLTNEKQHKVNDNEEEEGARGFWDSRIAYWLAACGSAVGLGNLWRFPSKVSAYGGGAFLIAYFVSLFAVGMPLLTQEMAMGKMFRGGDVEAYGRISPRLRGIGLASVIGSFGIVTYYSVVIAWSLLYFFKSFYKTLPWAEGEKDYFFNDILHLAPAVDESNWEVSWEVFGCTVTVWVLVYLAVFNGVRSMSKVVLVTMPVPILLLLVMLIKGATLDGAKEGVDAYLRTDVDTLSDISTWTAAVAQMFFSLSVCMGVMTAYSSYTKPQHSVATDEKVVAFADVGIAFMAGFAVYTVLGHLAETNGDDSVYSEGGLGLVFIVYPAALKTFDGANFFSAIFFLTLVMLGIDSAFSMVEAITTVLYDTDLFRRNGWSRPMITAIVCFISFLVSIIYTFDTGLYWFDIVDRYINEYGMIFIGMMECTALGWVFKYQDGLKVAGNLAVTIWGIFYWVGLFLGIVLGLGLAKYVDPDPNDVNVCGEWTGGMGSDSFYLGLGVCLMFWIFGAAIALVSADATNPNNIGANAWAIFGWHGCEEVRAFVNRSSDPNFVGRDWKYEKRALIAPSMLNIMWGWQIKYFIPSVLLLFLCDIMRKDSYAPYNCKEGSFPWGALSLGMIIFAGMVICVVAVAVFPSLMTQTWDSRDEAERQRVLEMAGKGKVDAQLGSSKGGIQSSEEPKIDTEDPDPAKEAATSGAAVGHI